MAQNVKHILLLNQILFFHDTLEHTLYS
jgi:hypothetical protein